MTVSEREEINNKIRNLRYQIFFTEMKEHLDSADKHFIYETQQEISRLKGKLKGL